MVISWLGINYICNLVIGLVMEQMFQVIIDVVDCKMCEVWNKSIEIVGICYVLVCYYICLVLDQVILVGLVYQIGVLLIFIYVEDYNELLLDFISLSYVIECIYLLIGECIFKVWDFFVLIVEVLCQYLDFICNLLCVDYIDLVQVVILQSYFGSEYFYICLDWSQILVFVKFGFELIVDMKEDEDFFSVLEVVISML